MGDIYPFILGVIASIVAAFIGTAMKYWLNYRQLKIKVKGKNQTIVVDAVNINESINVILEKKQPPQIFLSYSSPDKEFARKLAGDLEKNGIRVWYDISEIKVGDSLISKITEAITNSAYYGVFISKSSQKSIWVKKELSLMREKELRQKTSKILPILIEKTEIPNELKNRVYADFTKNYEDGLKKLLAKLKAN